MLASGAWWETVRAELPPEPPGLGPDTAPDSSVPVLADPGAESASPSRAGDTWTEPVTGMELVTGMEFM